MIIALLAVLGVDLVVIVVLVGSLLARRRWVSRREGAFRGAVRVRTGSVDGLGEKWNRGYGLWARDILVWTKGPLLLAKKLVIIDDVEQTRPALPGEVERLGEEPMVLCFRAGRAVVELAAGRGDFEVATGSYRHGSGQPPTVVDHTT